MPVLGLILSVYILTSLRKNYYFEGLKKPKNFLIALFIGTVICEIGWPLILIGYFFFQKTGVLDSMAENNLKNANRRESLKRRMEDAASGRPVAADSNPYRNGFQEDRDNYFNSTSEFGLDRAPKKRAAIIRKLNKLYDLNLKERQIESIVNASYASRGWAREVKAMGRVYASPYEWTQAGDSWLRIYLYAYSIMDIIPDYKLQEEVVVRAFDEAFTYGCGNGDLPLEVVVQNINSRFFTKFDELTFLKAVEYMKTKGKHYSFATSVMDTVNTRMEDLEAKYSKM